MAIVKVLAPITLQCLWCMFLIGMVNTSHLVCCGQRGVELRGRVVLARYLLVRIAPLAAGILFLVSKVDDGDAMSVTGRKLHALYLLGVGLSATSCILAVVALAFELYCVDACWPWVVLASVPVAAVHLVSVWFGVTGY